MSFPRPQFPPDQSTEPIGHAITRQEWERLEQRMLWLRERIKAKKAVGWETVYDQSEHDALQTALPLLKPFITKQ